MKENKRFTNDSVTLERLLQGTISVRNLLILDLFNSKVPILDIARAAGISSRDIYKIIPKKSRKKAKSI